MSILWYFLLAMAALILVLLSVPSDSAEPAAPAPHCVSDVR